MTLTENCTEVQKIYIYIFYLSSNQTRAPLLAPDYKRLMRYGSYQLLQYMLCWECVFSGSAPLTLFSNRNWNTQNNPKYRSDWPIFPIPKLKYNIFQNFCFGEQNAWINTKRIMTSFSSLSGRFSRQQRNWRSAGNWMRLGRVSTSTSTFISQQKLCAVVTLTLNYEEKDLKFS